jgi:two-component system, NarL family, nitrate/nitrite response regulator NarL
MVTPGSSVCGGVAVIVDVFLIAASRFYGEGLAQALQRAGIHLVGTAAGAEADVASMASHAPDIVLLDTAIPSMIGLLRTLTATPRAMRVIAIALPERTSDVLACVEAGASGYVTGDASLTDLVATIESVARGEMRCSPRITGTLLRRLAALAASRGPFPPGPKLTAREHEVLALLDEGLSNRQIAHSLYIELATVKNHVHHILEKLQVERRGEAIAYLRQQHLAAADLQHG